MHRFAPFLILLVCAGCETIVVERHDPAPPAYPLGTATEVPDRDHEHHGDYQQPPGVRDDQHHDYERTSGDRGDDRDRWVDQAIDRAYRELLERQPDPAGRDHFRQFLRQGGTKELMRTRIRESVEYRVTLPDSKTKQAYRTILGRDPDPVGLEGTASGSWTRAGRKRMSRTTSAARRNTASVSRSRTRACLQYVIARSRAASRRSNPAGSPRPAQRASR